MALEESILTGTKKLLDIGADDPSFDHNVISYINTAFFHLYQLGIGPPEGFQIEGVEEKWIDFLGEDAPIVLVNAVKTNISMRVRSIFDPPQLPHVVAAFKEQLLESDVRINTIREETGWVHPDPPDALVEHIIE